MNPWTRNAGFALLCLVAVALATVAGIYRTLWVRYDTALGQFESRSERIDGVIRAGSDIEKRLALARNAVAPMLHPSGENAQNDVQQKLRELITASGGTLVSSQVALETGADGKMDHVRLTATITGEWSRLVPLMQNMQTHRPVYWVRSATIGREGGTAAVAPQQARLTLQLDAPLAPGKAKP
ncbi:MAG: general secretion pathway protein GspM [Burkholderiales bacterium]|nr:general secretion pathway protein GspM [Burkholderiales bacterium]